MDRKNIAIILIFLLCVLGLMIGVYYTDTSEGGMKADDSNEVIFEDPNGTIIISMELKEKNESVLEKLFT